MVSPTPWLGSDTIGRRGLRARKKKRNKGRSNKEKKGREEEKVIMRLMCCRESRRNEGVLECICRKEEDKEYRRWIGWSQ